MKCYIQKGRNPKGSVNMKHAQYCTYTRNSTHPPPQKNEIKIKKVHGARGKEFCRCWYEKEPSLLKATSAKHGSKFTALSLVMVTAAG